MNYFLKCVAITLSATVSLSGMQTDQPQLNCTLSNVKRIFLPANSVLFYDATLNDTEIVAYLSIGSPLGLHGIRYKNAQDTPDILKEVVDTPLLLQQFYLPLQTQNNKLEITLFLHFLKTLDAEFVRQHPEETGYWRP